MAGKSLDNPARLLAKLLTEFVGTFVFLSVIALSGPLGQLAPLAIGSVLMVMVYMGGHVSGAHYNPAVTFGLFLRREIDALTMVLYWATQLLGAICAFIFGYLVSSHSPGIAPGSGVTTPKAFAVEAVFTLALVLVVLNAAATRATKGNSFYGLAIGFTIVVAAFAGGPISGGAFNPAVGFGATFGAAVYGSGGWSHLWLYIVAPLLGAAVAAGIHLVQIRGMKDD
ncbi:MAG TPA: aquaporin [Pseudonocardiaceae bacterium]